MFTELLPSNASSKFVTVCIRLCRMWACGGIKACVCMYERMLYVCGHVCMYVRTYVRMDVCMHVGLYICVGTYIVLSI
jgi:hypothetical protein